MSRSKLISLLFVTLCCSPTLLPGQEKSDAPKVASYLTDTAIGFAHVELDRLDLEPVKKFTEQFAASVGGEAERIEMMISLTQQTQKLFVDAGVTDAYIVLDLENLLFGPYVLLQYKEGADVAGITKQLQDVIQQLQVPAIKQYKTLDGFLFAGDEEILKHITSGHIADRPHLAAALASVDDQPLQVVICPSADQTRAIREAVPAFPAPYEQLDGKSLVSGLRYLSLGVHLEPHPGVRVVIQSADPVSAEVLLQAEQQAVSLVVALVAAEFPMPGIDKIGDRLKLRRENDRLLLDFSFQPEEWDRLAALLQKPAEGIRERSHDNQTVTNLKQFGLAMHNWHDVYKVLPAHANYDKNGKPYLSWRVHVLPYLGESALYDQFHLDEPWDSEHNKQFIAKMPKVFAVPGSEVSRTGRTGYMLPILKDGSALTTGTKDGIQLQEVTDGLSNTILVVVADDEHSTIWTKPDDLVIDPDKPLAGLRFDANDVVRVTFADGSVRTISKTIDLKKWLSLLTRAGGEPVGD